MGGAGPASGVRAAALLAAALALAPAAPASAAGMRAPGRLPAVPREGRLETSSLALGARALLGLYRSRVSPLTSGRCGFSPSCSSYGLEALRRRGALAGAVLIGDRLTRCNLFRGPADYTPLPDGRFWDPLEDNLP